MAIQQISLNQFRNLNSLTLDLHPKFNWIIGDNGSGKTSFLEAIYILCQGRSFKTHHLNQCINHHHDNFLLFSKFDDYKAGLTRNKSDTFLRIDGENAYRLSQLVEKTPVVSLNSKSFDLLLGPPNQRRAFLDWCLFHVEHQFRIIWQDFFRALKQKNVLLKNKSDLKQLNYWDHELAKQCEQIYSLRSSYLSSINELVIPMTKKLNLDSNISIEYKPGWPEDQELIEVMKSQRDRELKLGYSIVGSHRDLINVKSDNYQASEILSRGQLKLLTICLYISQILLVKNKTNKSIIVLIDDLDSELDDAAIKSVVLLLQSMNIQVFITNIRIKNDLLDQQQEYKMFHVEHGMITPVKN